MSAVLAMPFSEHLIFYKRFLINHWQHMTPLQYGGMLIVIAVVGWPMMKSSSTR